MKSGSLKMATAVLAAAALSPVSTSEAGKRLSDTTLVFGNNDVTAYMGPLRNSANPVELAECGITATTTSLTAFCTFINAVGTRRDCSTGNINLVATLANLSGDSAMYVQFSGGTCTYAEVITASWLQPKRL